MFFLIPGFVEHRRRSPGGGLARGLSAPEPSDVCPTRSSPHKSILRGRRPFGPFDVQHILLPSLVFVRA